MSNLSFTRETVFEFRKAPPYCKKAIWNNLPVLEIPYESELRISNETHNMLFIGKNTRAFIDADSNIIENTYIKINYFENNYFPIRAITNGNFNVNVKMIIIEDKGRKYLLVSL